VSPKGGIVREARRPAGWQAPGPRPAGPGTRADLWPGDDEDLCFLVGDWRIFQRVDGHRWSLDDLVTAHLAAESVAAPPARYLDIGCGLGSVLMSVAWRFPHARCLGIEAQAVSAGLARRSLAYNGAQDRVEIRDGDLRDPEVLGADAATFELVTGTPPYFPIGTGVESTLVQRGPCRFEHRGGVEAYLEAATRALTPAGRYVQVAAYGQAERIADAARELGMVIERRVDVVPRAGKAPLIVLHVMRRAGQPGAAARHDAITVRDAQGQWTPEFLPIRFAMGLPPQPAAPK
jgi:tRNA1Val (adenine37-N6)-methyltransferase